MAQSESIRKRLYGAMETNSLDEIKTLIDDLEIVCPISGSRNWTDVWQFNLMLSTQMGAASEAANKLFLRPETAQGIFVNFFERAKIKPDENPLWYCPNWKSLPKRNNCPAIYFQDAGI